MWLLLLQNIALFAILAMLGHRLGRNFLSNETKGLATIIGCLTAIALLSIAGTLIYYATSVTITSLIITGLIVTIGIIIITPKKEISQQGTFKDLTPIGTFQSIVPIIVVTISLITWWSVILSHPITDAVRSPWLLIDPIIIIAPAIAFTISFFTIQSNKTIGSILLFATLISIFASTTIVFPLGNGFDPFLHRATIAHIAEHGTITPKPLYYIGEYALELFAHLVGGLSIFSVDVLLIPILASITLTITARKLPIGATILLITLSNFINTTPQSLGYLWLLLTILTIDKTISSKNQLVIPSIFAIAAFTAHPVAGVPAILYIILSITQKSWQKLIVGLLSAISLPLMFIVQALISHAAIVLTPQNLWRLDQLPLSYFITSGGNTWLDLLYLIINNLTPIIFILAIIGAINNRSKYTAIEKNSGIIATSLIVSFVLISLGIDFSYLISYERQDFALRFLTLASLFALPLAAMGLKYFNKNLCIDRQLTIISSIIVFVVACAATYSLFPRQDGYAHSAAFNVSQADINTVYAIHNRETSDADYVVLANQATSSAALQEFGFRKYYHNDIFYYPIPTGGQLYQSYLSMVNNKPTLDTINSTMNLAGVHKVYFVVSDYWWNKDAIIDTAKTLTDRWFAVDNGKATVFIFTDSSYPTSP